MVDMANAYPKSTFHGVDISDTVPERSKLKNTIYSVGNIVKEPPCEDNFFDYIHQRLLVAGFTRDDWVNVNEQCYLHF
jgi:hypothetical protein